MPPSTEDAALAGDPGVQHDPDTRHVLQNVQPALVGLMDGSVSTLAPIFAAAFASHQSHTALLVGLASAVGAGISMAFAEGLSDSGVITGRGTPLRRGTITGIATFIGGILHTLPFLMHNLSLALIFAYAVVGVELIVIAEIRRRYMDANRVKSILQVIVGGALVFVSGLLIGHA
ncbi:MAG TPA: VIT1/CCC1 transporter family protein [Limnochordia bacterium]|nr:VIT1/CCC1 transporter family protein [Limnochordia bacterium]